MSIQCAEFSLSSRSWVYRGEGNANLVISLPQEGTVLRLRKSSQKEPLNEASVLEQLRIEVMFTDVVMRAVLGDAFIRLPSLVCLPKEDIEMLNSSLMSVRPEYRLKKSLSTCFAQLCEDFTIIPSIFSCHSKSVCIEIKPKQGVFPSTHLKMGKCTFCLKQQLKLVQGLASKRSQYCPLDLFSGDHLRMLKAIESLLCTPQNNLKIFLDGSLIYGEGDSLNKLTSFIIDWLGPLEGSDPQRRFSLLLIKALLKPFTYNYTSTSRRPDMPWMWNNDRKLSYHYGQENIDVNTEGSCNWMSCKLPEGCVLDRVATAQAIDSYGLDIISSCLPKKFETENTLCDNLQYVHKVLKKNSTAELDPVEAYLIATTARDCSILVTFQELETSSKEPERGSLPIVVDEESKSIYRFKMTAVDIDPKPFSSIKNQILKRKACFEENKLNT